MQKVIANIVIWLMSLLLGTSYVAAENNANTAVDLDDVLALETFMDGVLSGQFKSLDISGVAISIVKDNKVIFAKGYGYADGKGKDKIDPARHLFRIASISKTFTGTAVMQLFEEGKLDLDVDVNRYLTGFKIPDTYKEPVTLRYLLTHSAGFEDGWFGYNGVYDLANSYPLQESLMKHVPARVNPVGLRTAYSNYGFALAGLIVENVSGVPFNQYIKENIFDPLDMKQSTFFEPIPENLSDDIVMSQAREGGVLKEKPFLYMKNLAPAGAMSTSALDMANFMMAQLNRGKFKNKQILRPETLKYMHRQAVSHDERLAGLKLVFSEINYNGRQMFGHGGSIDFAYSDMVLDPLANLGIFVTYAGAEGSLGRDQIIESFFDRYYSKDIEVSLPPKDFAERADQYTGQYWSWRRNLSKIEKFIYPLMGITVEATSSNTLLISGMGWTTRQYSEIGEDLFQEVGGKERIVFKKNSSGVITHIFRGSQPYHQYSRVPFYYTSAFNFPMVIASIFVFVTIFISYGFRREYINSLAKEERNTHVITLVASGTHLLFLASLFMVIMVNGEGLITSVPSYLWVVLLLPMIALFSSAVQTFNTVKVWRHNILSLSGRLRQSLFTLLSLFMCWFYYFWNLLGFQYF